MTACTLHIKWFPLHQEYKWPQWPQQPQKPQWPQWPQQPHFIKKFTDEDDWIIPGPKMTNTCPFLCNGSSKIQFFTGIWDPFDRRLLRPAYATFLKTIFWWIVDFFWPNLQRFSTMKIDLNWSGQRRDLSRLNHILYLFFSSFSDKSKTTACTLDGRDIWLWSWHDISKINSFTKFFTF